MVHTLRNGHLRFQFRQGGSGGMGVASPRWRFEATWNIRNQDRMVHGGWARHPPASVPKHRGVHDWYVAGRTGGCRGDGCGIPPPAFRSNVGRMIGMPRVGQVGAGGMGVAIPHTLYPKQRGAHDWYATGRTGGCNGDGRGDALYPIPYTARPTGSFSARVAALG